MKGMLSRDQFEAVVGRGAMNSYLMVLRLIGVIWFNADGRSIAHNSA